MESKISPKTFVTRITPRQSAMAQLKESTEAIARQDAENAKAIAGSGFRFGTVNGMGHLKIG